MQFLRRQLEKNANKIHTTWNMQKAFKNVRNKHRVVLIVWKYLIGKTESESVCCSSAKLDWKLNAIQCFAKHSILHQWWIGCFLMCWPPSNGRASNWPTHTHTHAEHVVFVLPSNRDTSCRQTYFWSSGFVQFSTIRPSKLRMLNDVKKNHMKW